MKPPLITSSPARVLCDCNHSEERQLVKMIEGTKKNIMPLWIELCNGCNDERDLIEKYKPEGWPKE